MTDAAVLHVPQLRMCHVAESQQAPFSRCSATHSERPEAQKKEICTKSRTSLENDTFLYGLVIQAKQESFSSTKDLELWFQTWLDQLETCLKKMERATATTTTARTKLRSRPSWKTSWGPSGVRWRIGLSVALQCCAPQTSMSGRLAGSERCDYHSGAHQ